VEDHRKAVAIESHGPRIGAATEPTNFIIQRYAKVMFVQLCITIIMIVGRKEAVRDSAPVETGRSMRRRDWFWAQVLS